MNDAELLRFADVTVDYGAIRALHGVSFGVRAGEIVALIGANGAGKTTALRAATGLLQPTSGAVFFRGQRITGDAPFRIARRGLAHVPEGRGIFPSLTVQEHLQLGGRSHEGSGEYPALLERGFTLFPILRERRTQKAGTLSGGEQQMLAIARALMSKPTLLVLDEPSLGLAPLFVARLFDVIRTINQGGTTVLLVEQNARQALQLAHHGVVLETGRVALALPARELLDSAHVRRAYLGG